MIFRMPDPVVVSVKIAANASASRRQSTLAGIVEEDEEMAFSDYAGPSHDYTPNSLDLSIADPKQEEHEQQKRQKLLKSAGIEFDSEKDQDLYFDTLGRDTAVEWEHDVVAVGGTFDHLHDGHRVLLTVAGYLAKECLIVGITGAELLTKKKYAEVLESYMTRQLHVEEFLEYVFPQLDIETHMIHDVSGPTATIEDIDALVLSRETIKGGIEVNKIRLEKGFKPLIVYDVDVIGCVKGNAKDRYSDKLSSTELRRLEFEKLSLGK